MEEDWDVLTTFFPEDWRTRAAETGALKGLRKDKSPEGLLRVLLLHLGRGHSLREPVFKRFKTLAKLGQLPKRDDESARAWLYGKLFTALLAEKLIRHAADVSPWGCGLRGESHP